MTTYSDAIGYLRDLGHEEGIPWFEMICDLAASGESTLSEHNLELLIKLFRGSGSYQRQPLHPRTAVSSALSTMAVERLERIGPFNSFKRLGDTLTASFDKRVTIIFGTNGSGKSSLCEALKILASNEVPRRPLQNIHTKSATSPAFAFKFATDLATNNWTILDPCGYKSAVLKYFDSGVALQNIQNSVQPGRIIKLTPFKLDVFETAKNLCEELRTELQQDQSTNSKILLQTLEQIRNKFNVFKDSVLASLTMPTAEILDSQIKLGEEYSEDCRLNEKLQRKSQLEKATSEEGIKIIKGEIASIRALYAGIQPLLQASDGLIEIEPISTSRMLKEKEKELEVIAKYLIPAGSTIDKLMALIRPANEIYDLNSPELSRCPLCKQGLGDSELELFKKYSELLTGELQEAIIRFRKSLELSDEYYRIISSSIPDDWAQDSVLVSTRIDSIKKSGRLIKEIFKPGLEISHDCLEAVKDLKNKGEELLESLNEKASLIKKAETSRSALVIELNKISEECQKLLYYKLVAENLDILKEAYRRIKIDDFWVDKLPIFKSILKKITITAKKAHKELVVSDFRAHLNAEYLALAEKDMSEFGVELKDIGEEGAVTVDHHIAGKRIEEVLSEGEQRIHALALFFAELETCEQQVIIFDDPVSSFDYNYIGNYCNRLRDFISVHPNRQIIVLTHNWEFFVQIQTTINASGLTSEMSVLVLEGCVTVREYSEKIEELSSEIETTLAIDGEPTNAQKETMAGKMRRLIEAIINTYVFNNQRHQFKQKNQQVSTFINFTRLVPLLPSEAQTFKDLYAKLSITEHDDPRNAYIATDKSMFQTRYSTIKAIETAIIGRKPK